MRKLTIEEAISVIVPGTSVHTFVRSLGWMGADMDRAVVIAAIQANDGAEVSDEAAHFDHELAMPIQGRRTFIETDKSKVNQLLSGPRPERKMTKMEFDAESSRLETLIALEDAGKKNPRLSLAEKVAHNRERNRLQDILHQHKLNYFELVAEVNLIPTRTGTSCPPGPVLCHNMEQAQRLTTEYVEKHIP